MKKVRQNRSEDPAPESAPVYDASLSLPVIAIAGRPNVVVTSMAKCFIHVDIIEREFFLIPFQIIIW